MEAGKAIETRHELPGISDPADGKCPKKLALAAGRIHVAGVMKLYSDLVDSVWRDDDLLKKLHPKESSNIGKILQIRASDDAKICDGLAVVNAGMFPLLRGGLLYACDAIDESHGIVQKVDGDESAYWHGMLHRREGDFDNARYWFRRAGTLPVFNDLHHAACSVSPIVAAQSNWDPYLFTGLCEQNKFGETETTSELAKLQRIEFEKIFDYTWRRIFTPPVKR